MRLVLRAARAPAPARARPAPIVRALAALGEALLGAARAATWDEAELLEVSLTTPRGAADAERARRRAAADGRGARRRPSAAARR